MSDYDDWDVDYCNRRLKECMLFHEDKLWRYLRAINNKNSVAIECESPISKDRKTSSISNMNLATPKFGFTNLLGRSSIEAAFVARTPIREDWRQGIRARQLVVDGKKVDEMRLFGAVDNLKALQDTLANKFENIKKAIFLVEEEYDKIALSRNFAMDHQFNIYYQNQGRIGKLNADDRIKLGDPWNRFLKEHVKAELKMEVI